MNAPKYFWPLAKHPKELIFLGREYHSIKGKKSTTLVMLSAIVFFSLFSIMLGKAGLDYLNFKMNDPFIKWFNIAPTMNQYSDMKHTFDQGAEANIFSISQSSGAYRGMWRFYKQSSAGSNYGFVQSFSFWNDEQLWKSILFEGNNLLHAFTDLKNLSSDDLQDGIIITQKLMMELEADASDLQSKRLMIKNGDNLPLRVLAVVRTLPNRSQVFAENSLVYCLSKAANCEVSGSSLETSTRLEILINSDGDNHEKNYNHLLESLTKMNLGLKVEGYSISKDLDLLGHNLRYDLTLGAPINNRLRLRIQDELSKDLLYLNPAVGFNHSVPVPHISRIYGEDSDQSGLFDLLAVKIEDPAQIPVFQEAMYDYFQVELDMNQVEAKKNFFVVSFLAIFLIISLVFFAGFAILVYLYNLMKGHLEKIKTNIGTFLAFGMTRKFLYKGYMTIILRLMITATIISMATLLAMQFILRAANATIELPEIEFFAYTSAVNNLWVWSAIVVFFVVSYLLFRKQLNTFLAHPPGDLIYGRK